MQKGHYAIRSGVMGVNMRNAAGLDRANPLVRQHRSLENYSDTKCARMHFAEMQQARPSNEAVYSFSHHAQHCIGILEAFSSN